MKAMIIAAVAAAALSAGTIGAQAENETDRAMGAGSYIHPNGPAKGVWIETPTGASHAGTAVNHEKR